MSQETPFSTSPHSGDEHPQQRGQFFSNRGRGRGYHQDGRGRGYHPDRGTGYYRDVYYRRGGGFHQENRGRGFQGDTRGGGYHAEHRGRDYQAEGRGRGYHQQDSHGGYYQENKGKPVNPQETLDYLGVKDLRQHLENKRLEGQTANNPPNTYSDEPRSQHSPRGGARSRGRSGSRGRGRSEDRGSHHQHLEEGSQPEIYINDVYNIKVEMSTSTGQKTYQLVREDRLDNLKHVPDYEDEEDWSPPIRPHYEFQRGQGANRRGPGRGRGRGRGRGGHVPRSDDWHATGGEDAYKEGRSDRGRGRGNKHRMHYDSGAESKHFQKSNTPPPYENTETDVPKMTPEPVVESEENWDLEIAEYEAAQKQEARHNEETNTDDRSEQLKDHENVSSEDYAEVRSEDFTENQDVPGEYYPEEGEYYEGSEQYHEDNSGKDYEYEGNDGYGTVYAEECENYPEENVEAVENYEGEFRSNTCHDGNNVRAFEVQNVDENNLAIVENDSNSEGAKGFTENGANNVNTQDSMRGQEEGRFEVNKSNPEQAEELIEDKACVDTQETKTLKDDVQPVLSQSSIEESKNDDKAVAKQSKKAKDKKKKVRINAP